MSTCAPFWKLSIRSRSASLESTGKTIVKHSQTGSVYMKSGSNRVGNEQMACFKAILSSLDLKVAERPFRLEFGHVCGVSSIGKEHAGVLSAVREAREAEEPQNRLET